MNNTKQYGSIYGFIGPDGYYIGQTRQPTMYRYNQHKNSAANINLTHGCTSFNEAIRLHGWNAFKFIIIMHECELSLLNYWEKYYIKHYNSMYPNGYNLTAGGSRNTEYSDLSRLKCSDSRRKNGQFYELTRDLPLGVMIHSVDDIPLGYTVIATKDRHQAKFWDSSRGLEENRRLAIEYVKNGKKQEKELPRFIEKTEKGYIVNCRIYVNGKTIRYGYKRFENSNITFPVKLEMALAELNRIKELYKV